MSWFSDSSQPLSVRFTSKILKNGPIPKHIAFIMDGNRRYAKKKNMNSVVDGHYSGFESLTKTLEWCKELGISEVTVYAFSIENFKRSEEEVEGLMNLVRKKFQELIDEKEKLKEHQVKFQFFGNLEMLPDDIQSHLAKITYMTKDYDRSKLNVCMSYTAQDEIRRAVEKIGAGVSQGRLEPEDVSEELISKCLDTRGSPDPDLLIRTSGELRFSDFMLWQCSHSCIYFDDVLWPEFSFWNLCSAIMYYQKNFSAIQAVKNARNSDTSVQKDESSSKRIEDFLSFSEQSVWNDIIRKAGDVENS